MGGVYTSLTGFTKESSTGTIQLCALGRMLESSGFKVWDFGMGGMGMEYKYSLGALDVPRKEFLRVLDTFCEIEGLTLKSCDKGVSAVS